MRDNILNVLSNSDRALDIFELQDLLDNRNITYKSSSRVITTVSIKTLLEEGLINYHWEYAFLIGAFCLMIATLKKLHFLTCNIVTPFAIL